MRSVPPLNRKNAADDPLSETEFARIAELVFELTGISLKPHKKSMVSGRMARLLRGANQTDVQSYLNRVMQPEGAAERDRFVSAYTTNMTRFNREERHFVHLSEHVLPGLIARARAGQRIRLWSAGCSSGEEPYQIAFHILDNCPDAARLNIKVLATDVDRDMLAMAETGIYPRANVAALPNSQMQTHFDRLSSTSDRLSVQNEARNLVVFRHLNVHETWPFEGRFDVIMCRNVAIYFDDDVQSRMWFRFANQLTPQGVLYIGHSETLDAGSAGQFESIGGNAAFQLKIGDTCKQGGAVS